MLSFNGDGNTNNKAVGLEVLESFGFIVLLWVSENREQASQTKKVLDLKFFLHRFVGVVVRYGYKRRREI